MWVSLAKVLLQQADVAPVDPVDDDASVAPVDDDASVAPVDDASVAVPSVAPRLSVDDAHVAVELAKLAGGASRTGQTAAETEKAAAKALLQLCTDGNHRSCPLQ